MDRSVRGGALAVLACAFLATCTDGPTGTDRGARLSIAPSFSQAALRAAAQLASFSMDIDNVRIVIIDPPSDTLVDTTVVVPPGTDTLTVELAVPGANAGDVFTAGIQLRHGDQVLFAGEQEVTAHAAGSGAPSDVPTTFVGPGASAVFLEIGPRDTTVSGTDSVIFRSQALDANENPVLDAQVLWTSSDETRATIDDGGVLHATGQPGNVTITARTLGGLRDSTGVTLKGAATKLVMTTQPPSSVKDRKTFPTQPVVQIADANGNPIALPGVSVVPSLAPSGALGSRKSSSVVSGATLGDATPVVTDASGKATFTNLSIVGTVGDYVLTFAAEGFASKNVPITLLAGDASQMAAHAGQDQQAAVNSAVPVPPAVLVSDADGNAVSGVTVTYAVASGGGSATGKSPTTNASGEAAVGSWTLGPSAGTNTLTATATGLTGSPVTFTATAVAGTTFTYNFCPQENLQWFAYQNFGGPWTAVTITNNSAVFTVSTEKFAMAWVAVGGSPYVQIVYGTLTDFASTNGYVPDCSTMTGKTIAGSVAGVVDPQSAAIDFGGAYATATQTTPTFSLSPVQDGALDLVAARFNDSFSPNYAHVPDALIVRRGLNLADGSTIPVLDFNNTIEVRPPAANALTIAGLLGSEQAWVDNFFQSPTTWSEVASQQLNIGQTSATMHSMPSSLLVAGDVNYLEVFADNSDNYHGLLQFYDAPGDQSATIGPVMSNVTVSDVATSPYLIEHVAVPSQTEYGSSMFISFSQSTAQRYLYAAISSSYTGGTPTTWDFTIPDFSGLAGFAPTWMLAAGEAPNWFVDVYGDFSSTSTHVFASRNGTGPTPAPRPLAVRASFSGHGHHPLAAQSLFERRYGPAFIAALRALNANRR